MVSVPILYKLPEQGWDEVSVLGVATFYIAKWDRKAPWSDTVANTTMSCKKPGKKDKPPFFECQMVWGYFMQNARPPEDLLRIGDSTNPFAPLMFALTE